MNKTALITGAGTGLGQALALNLAEKGLNVIIIGRRQHLLEQTKAYYPNKISWLSADVGKEKDREKIVAALSEKPAIDYLVHNAGTNQPMALLKDVKLSDWHHAFATNVEGPLFLTQILLPKLKQARILHISSGFAHVPFPYFGVYCITKAALFMLYQQFKQEFIDKNITFASVMPGVVETPMQTFIRNQDSAVRHYFQDLKDQNKTIPAVLCAKFLSWILLDTNPQTFSEKEWDIYDTSHHNYWLEDEILPRL